MVEGPAPANVVYYCRIGVGDWLGDFDFRLTDWRRFRADSIGLKNRFLALGLITIFRIFRSAPISSNLTHEPDSQPIVVDNLVRIYKFGVTLYLLREHYTLAPDGRDVHVDANERFGPIPFLFNNHKSHPAEILDLGHKAIYYIPLLGISWTGVYEVSEDEGHLHSTLSCDWAVGHEVIHKLSGPTTRSA
jgi:hypothetical protein